MRLYIAKTCFTEQWLHYRGCVKFQDKAGKWSVNPSCWFDTLVSDPCALLDSSCLLFPYPIQQLINYILEKYYFIINLLEASASTVVMHLNFLSIFKALDVGKLTSLVVCITGQYRYRLNPKFIKSNTPRKE